LARGAGLLNKAHAMLLLSVWMIPAILVALIAVEKGRDGVRWFLFGIFAWPAALPLVLFLKRPGA
jgi:hypothetical protein